MKTIFDRVGELDSIAKLVRANGFQVECIHDEDLVQQEGYLVGQDLDNPRFPFYFVKNEQEVRDLLGELLVYRGKQMYVYQTDYAGNVLSYGIYGTAPVFSDIYKARRYIDELEREDIKDFLSVKARWRQPGSITWKSLKKGRGLD